MKGPAQAEVRQGFAQVGATGGELQVRFPYTRPDAAALWVELTIRAGIDLQGVLVRASLRAAIAEFVTAPRRVR